MSPSIRPSFAVRIHSRLYAVGGPPLGVFCLWQHEWLAGICFLSLGLGCAIHVIDGFIKSPPAWMARVALWSAVASFAAIVAFTVTHFDG